jgi:leader peptidase (prepilin peptidase) / N-methyltransferase
MRSNSIVLCSLLFAAGVLAFLYEAPADAIFGITLAALALVIARSDINRFEIPDWANGLMFLLGLGWVFCSSGSDSGAVPDALSRSLAAAGFLYAVRIAYYRVRGVVGLGLGDVKLAAAGAPWLSWPLLPFTLLIAVSAALFLIAIQAVIGTRRIEANLALPLGAFLAPAIWLVWFANGAG